jgi:hypothetical protein
MITQSKLKAAATIMAASVALAFVPNAHAVTQAGHDHSVAGTPTMKLNAGHKWQTDAALREGMGKISTVIESNLENVHGGKVTTAQYKAIAADINGQVAYIVQNCKLDKDADAVLHGIIGGISEGVEAMEGGNKKVKPSAGFVKVAQSLDSYGKVFDHAGWKAVKAVH